MISLIILGFGSLGFGFLLSWLFKKLFSESDTVEANINAKEALECILGKKLGLLLGVPIFGALEEVLWRGLLFLLPVMLTNFSIISILLFGTMSTALWAFAHIASRPPKYAYIQLLFAGIAYCLFAIATNSIILGMFVHITINSLAFIGLKQYIKKDRTK
jgi:membrane protease YdiL (CAAX protease family)